MNKQDENPVSFLSSYSATASCVSLSSIAMTEKVLHKRTKISTGQLFVKTAILVYQTEQVTKQPKQIITFPESARTVVVPLVSTTTTSQQQQRGNSNSSSNTEPIKYNLAGFE